MSIESIGWHGFIKAENGARSTRTPGWGLLLLGTVGGATTLAFARVLALAAIVAGAAAALAFARVQAFTRVLFNLVVRGLASDGADGGTRGCEFGARPAGVCQRGRTG